MARSRRERGKRHSPEQIVRKLREADAMLSAGKSVGEVLQQLGSRDHPASGLEHGDEKCLRDRTIYRASNRH